MGSYDDDDNGNTNVDDDDNDYDYDYDDDDGDNDNDNGDDDHVDDANNEDLCIIGAVCLCICNEKLTSCRLLTADSKCQSLFKFELIS